MVGEQGGGLGAWTVVREGKGTWESPNFGCCFHLVVVFLEIGGGRPISQGRTDIGRNFPTNHGPLRDNLG